MHQCFVISDTVAVNFAAFVHHRIVAVMVLAGLKKYLNLFTNTKVKV